VLSGARSAREEVVASTDTEGTATGPEAVSWAKAPIELPKQLKMAKKA
jgi:hypothetical protein